MKTRRSAQLVRTSAHDTRARAAFLCERSLLIRQQADVLSDRAVQNLVDSNESGVRDRGNILAFRLARLPSAIRLVRHRVRRWLEDDGVAPEEAFRIALACSEVCANAVEHPVSPAQQAFEVEAKRERDVVRVAVRDFGGWNEAHSRTETRGRGLRMIRALVDRVEITSNEEGTEVVLSSSVRSGAPDARTSS